MADRCLKVLGDRSKLSNYAKFYWPEHAKQCGKLASSWIADNSHFFGERSEIRTCRWQFHREMLPYTHQTIPEKQLNPPNLHMACDIGFTQWAKHILSSKRRLLEPWKRSINHYRKDLATPLHFAVFGGNWETVEYLLEKGADPNINCVGLQSPFHYSILRLDRFPKGYAILERMLARGADVNLVLRRAIDLRDAVLLELAIKYNANLLMKEKWGFTCLHWAVVGCEYDQDNSIIRRLLEAGADPWIKDSNGKTALQYLHGPTRAGQYLTRKLQKIPEEKSIAIKSMFEEFGYSCASDPA
jgi:hypothetical protein